MSMHNNEDKFSGSRTPEHHSSTSPCSDHGRTGDIISVNINSSSSKNCAKDRMPSNCNNKNRNNRNNKQSESESADEVTKCRDVANQSDIIEVKNMRPLAKVAAMQHDITVSSEDGGSSGHGHLMPTSNAPVKLLYEEPHSLDENERLLGGGDTIVEAGVNTGIHYHKDDSP